MKTKTSPKNLQPSTCTLQQPWSAFRPNVNHLRMPGQPLRFLRWMFSPSFPSLASVKNSGPRSAFAVGCLVLGVLLLCGCQVLTYSSPTGERFSRSSLGANTSLQSLAVEANTNVRRVELFKGRNPFNQASHCDIAWAGALTSHVHVNNKPVLTARVG